MDTGHPDQPADKVEQAGDVERLRQVFARQEVFNAIERPTLGDLAESGLYSYAGRLSDPRGWWHCQNCWMDYAVAGQYREAA